VPATPEVQLYQTSDWKFPHAGGPSVVAPIVSNANGPLPEITVADPQASFGPTRCGAFEPEFFSGVGIAL
jgi:hypothetical protein